MKKLLALLLIVVMLTGCQFTDGWDEPIGSGNREPVTNPGGHTDHTAVQARQEKNFFVECERNEGICYYLSYQEPDGCVTRIFTFNNNDREPDLYVHDRSFYFVDLNWGRNDGTLCAVFFSGEVRKMDANEGIELNYILRIDEEGIYCCANEGDIYLKVSLDLDNWEIVSRDEARTSP